MPATHTDKAFEQDLRDLRQKLLAMGAKVELLIADSLKSLTDRDSKLADKVVQSDAEVNRLEVEIDNVCRRVLALRQPAASDLRLITTALKIVTDLERCGDMAVSIANWVKDLNEAVPLAPHSDLPRLSELAQAALKRALESFVASDAEQAEQVLKGDAHLDALFLKIFNELLALMTQDSKNIRRATGLMFIGKHLERIGDHAENIAEMVIYMARGTDVRHPMSRALKR